MRLIKSDDPNFSKPERPIQQNKPDTLDPTQYSPDTDDADDDYILVPRLSKSIRDALVRDRDAHEENDQQQAHRLFQEYAVPAAYEIIRIALHGDTDRIRLQAATHVVDRALGRVQDNAPEVPQDPFKELLAKCVMEYSEPALTIGEQETEEMEIIDAPTEP